MTAQPGAADSRVAAELYRSAFLGDRRAAVAAMLASLFVASALEQQGVARFVWLWCGACVMLAVTRGRLFRLGYGVERLPCTHG
jgi:hypothetical protein